jgi:hypothetical protein
MISKSSTPGSYPVYRHTPFNRDNIVEQYLKYEDWIKLEQEESVFRDMMPCDLKIFTDNNLYGLRIGVCVCVTCS